MQIIIDKEFQSLIPPLTAEEYEGLEKSILEEGCRDAIVVWEECEVHYDDLTGYTDVIPQPPVIIDGHNRYKICTAHNIPFKTVKKDFADRNDALRWIILNQFGRRNLPAYERARLALRLKPVIAEKAKEKEAERKTTFQKSEKSSMPQVNTTKEIAKAAGVSHDTIAKVEKIERQAAPEVKEQLRKGELSINQAYKAVRREENRQKWQTDISKQVESPRASTHVDIFTTDRKYRVIYADPPWSYGDKQNIEGLGGAVKHYPTMPLDDICALPVPAADNAVLFMWVTSPLLEDSFKVINAWGFKYKSSFVWDKVAHNMGHYNSVRHEFLLIATKGSCTPDVKKLYDSVVSIERTEHSRKPKEFREMIDTLYPVGERLEMFAREAPEGWDVWGNMA